MTASGQLERFPPERLNGRCRIDQETTARGYSGDGLAPKPAGRLPWLERVKPTQSRPSWALMVAAAHAPFPVVLAPQSEHLTTALTNDGRGMAEPLPR